MTIYNVKDYGATGNGITDDTAAIQAAVNAAKAAGGGDVYVPAGTYIVTGHNEPSDGAIMLYDNIHLYGDGMGATNIKVADGWNMKMTGVIRTEYGISTNNVTVDNLTIDGNRDNVSVKVDGWFNGFAPGKIGHDSNITLDRVEIKDCSGYGFDPHEQTFNLTISNSVSHGNGLDGFVADFIVGGSYINNVAYDNDRHGFNIVTSSSNLLISNNIAYDNGATGIVVQRGSDDIAWVHDVTISNNTVYNNALEGVLLKLSNYISVLDNDIYGNGKNGIRLYGTDHNTISGNKIHDNSQSKLDAYEEIRIQSYDETKGVSGNYYTSVYNTITNNILGDDDSDSNYGIRESADGTDYNTITLNIIKGYSVDAVVLAGSHSTWDRYTESTNDGNDIFIGTALAESIDGGLGDDTIDGGAGRDTLVGGAGADVFLFSNASDSNDANAQDRIMDFTVGVDKIDVSALGFTALVKSSSTLDGQLRLVYSATSNRTYVRSEQSAFEVVLNGDYRTTLTTSDFVFAKPLLNQLINGTSGKDVLIGGEGNDTLVGGASGDTLTGGNGADVFKFTSLSDSSKSLKTYDGITDFTVNVDKIDLSGLGFNHLTAGTKTAAGELRMAYSATSDRTYVRSDQQDFEFYIKGDVRNTLTDSDFIFTAPVAELNINLAGTSGADTLTGTVGNDTLSGSSGNDVLYGLTGQDVLIGGSGDDTIYGGSGNDTINGNTDNDSIDAGEGDDRISIAYGNDTITGGSGADLFIFANVGGTITDFTDGEDRIDLRSFGITINQAVNTIVGTDTTVDVYGSDGLVQAHILLSNFTGVLDTSDIIV